MPAERSVRQRQSKHSELSLNRILAGNPAAIRAGLQEMFSSELLMALSDGSRGNVEIVLAEALNNVVEHAYANYTDNIEIGITCGNGFLFVRIADAGIPMPGDDLPGGRLWKATDSQHPQEGGFGWYLIRSLSQDLTYARDGSLNILGFCIGVDYGA